MIFLWGIFGPNHKVEVIDSNSLPGDWKDKIDRINPNMHYRQDQLNVELLAHEEDTDSDNVDELEATPNSSHLPKRVIAFSSKTLLSLFQRRVIIWMIGSFVGHVWQTSGLGTDLTLEIFVGFLKFKYKETGPSIIGQIDGVQF